AGTSTASPLALAPELDFRAFLGVIPPSFGYGAEITRLRRRAAEHVPIRYPVRCLLPGRNPITAVPEDPVQGAAGGHQGRPRQRCDNALDQGIDYGVGYAGKIVGSLEGSRLRRKERAKRISRRRRETEAIDGDIEVEIVTARAILHRIDDAKRRIDAERFEVPDERQVVRLERRLVNQKFQGERLAVGLHAFGVLHRVAGLAEELRSFAQQCAILAGTIRHWRRVRLAKYLIGQLAAERLEQGDFFRTRRA